MPVFARYWADPQKHRAEVRKRLHKLTALGIPSGQHLSLPAQINRLESKKFWIKTHKKANAKANKKYHLKLTRLFGSCSAVSMWQYHMLKEAQNAKLRKSRAASL